MKFLLFLAISFISRTAFGQADTVTHALDTIGITTTDTAVVAPPKISTTAMPQTQTRKSSYPKTVVKINLSSLLLKNYNFVLERALTRKISVALGYRFMPPTRVTKLPLVEKVTERVDDSQTDEDGESASESFDETLGDLTVSNKTFTGEFQFYSGRKPGPRGFYVGLYGRYARFKADKSYVYQTTSQSYSLPMAYNLTGIGGGAGIGVQWLIGKRVALNWQILGLHFGSLNGSSTAAADLSTLSEQDKDKIKAELEQPFGEDIKIKNVTATVSNAGVHQDLNWHFYGVRTGIHLGISF